MMYDRNSYYGLVDNDCVWCGATLERKQTFSFGGEEKMRTFCDRCPERVVTAVVCRSLNVRRTLRRTMFSRKKNNGVYSIFIMYATAVMFREDVVWMCTNRT
jgi:hypothetical protein